MKKFSAFIFAVIFFLAASPAFACLCDGKTTVAEEIREAAAIFSARYVGAEYRRGIVSEMRELQARIDGKKAEYETLVLKFETLEWWKGAPSKEIVLLTNQTREADGTESILDCDYVFERGKTYLIYAYGRENELGTSVCARTAPLKRAKEDLRVLGTGRRLK